MFQPRARLVCPALRWRRGSFRSNRATIDAALAAGVGGFILFGGTRDAVTALTRVLRDIAGPPRRLGSAFERGPVPGPGRWPTDWREELPGGAVPASWVRAADCAPFAAAVQAGVGSVMPAQVAYPAWDSTGSAATFSKPILGYLRDTIRFDGLVV